MPRHRMLISINKRNTGQVNDLFNERHDWNSLLSHDEQLLMKHYSKDIFPPADVLVQYLKDYQSRLNISVAFDTDISNIQRLKAKKHKGYRFSMEDQRGKKYLCR